jgi:hypothetical protein
MTDFGASGLVAVLTGSGPDLVEDASGLEFCAARPIAAIRVTSKPATRHRDKVFDQRFVMGSFPEKMTDSFSGLYY